MKRLAVVGVGVAVALAAFVGWRAWRHPPAEPPGTSGPRAAGNILLITIDTLRADAVGAYGATGARTPVLDRLAQEGVLFERAYAVAPITLTSHASMLTGFYPPGHGARHNGIRMRDDVATVAERFKASGVRTGAFVSAYPLDRSFGLARGFDVYSDRMPRGPDGRPANERTGQATVDEAIAWLRESAGARFFAWVHLFEPHAPYGDPEAGLTVRQRYAGEVTEADRQIGRLLDALGEFRRETAVVVAADHGEAFGEHGEVAHSVFVYDTTLRVPLIVAGPGISPRRDSRDTSLVDLAPTIAGLAGLERWDVDGVDLRPDVVPGRLPRTRRLYAESFAPLVDFGWSSLRSLRRGDWKYIAAPRPELYNVGHDPAEQKNVLETEPALAAELAAAIDRMSGPELPEAAAHVDPEARSRLQALGYASGSRSGAGGARRDPKDARALAASIALMLSGELRGAELERAVRGVLAEDPDNPQANLRLAYAQLQAGRCAEAERLFARAVANGIAGADAQLGLATCQGRRGATAAALQSLEEARKREPQNPVVIANIGIALAAINQHARAVAALRDALAIDPDLHEARFNLALAYARTGDRAAAYREARTLLDRLPPDAPQRPEVERLAQAVK